MRLEPGAGAANAHRAQHRVRARRSDPRLYTCDGRDISPPLRWSGIPGDATQLMLVMNDLDAPGGDFIHWQMSELSPRSGGLSAGGAPAVGIAGTNSFGTTGYRDLVPAAAAVLPTTT